MQKIVHNGILLGIKIDKITPGSRPLTDPREFIQIVTLKHSRGTYLQAHIHRPKIRRSAKLQECMIVTKGKVRLSLYTLDKKPAKQVTLNAGQAFICLNCGVGMTFLETAEIIEVKNGPFKVDKVLI